MLNIEHVGKVLLYMYDTVKVEKIGNTSDGKEWYFINSNYPNDANGYYDLWEEEKITQILNRQDYYKEIQEREREREKQEQIRLENEARAKAVKEDLFGFTDNKSPMQHGKILKCLMKNLIYKNRLISRKDFIILKLKEGYSLNIKTFSNCYNRRAKKETKTSIMLCCPNDNSFYEITKTEYNFAQYLLDNDLIKQLA